MAAIFTLHRLPVSFKPKLSSAIPAHLGERLSDRVKWAYPVDIVMKGATDLVDSVQERNQDIFKEKAGREDYNPEVFISLHRCHQNISGHIQ